MKDVCMLLGFSMGLVTGVLLYKYSNATQKAVDKGEKAVKKEINMAAEKIESAAQKAKKAVQKKTK